MDVADQRTGITQVKDDVAEKCQKLFQDFLEEWVFSLMIEKHDCQWMMSDIEWIIFFVYVTVPRSLCQKPRLKVI